jgi:hypothetical protein
LTDPSHKDQHYGAFVTKTERGETSFPPQAAPSPCCSSSGVSSCGDSDDEGSTHSGFDDDECEISDDDEDDIRASHRGKKFTTDNGYVMTAFDQTNSGSWGKDQPLPLPLWNQNQKPTLVVDKLYDYEDIVALIETTLQHMIQETHYDTVNNFIHFYQSYRKSRFEKLNEFFRNYIPEINRQNHMCVSLGMEIISRVALLRPDIAEHFYLVSCEEAVENAIGYAENCNQPNIDSVARTLEKEHVLVAMKIRVADREGMLLLDPGYHVARAVTIMQDEKYPHTNFFVQSDEPGCKREYCYSFSDRSRHFVTWHERTTRNGEEMHEESIIYTERPFKSAVDVTARRNLVYEFRSLVSRDAKGRVFAGLYFPIVEKAGDSASLTIFYSEGIDNKMLKTKIRFAMFKEGGKVRFN